MRGCQQQQISRRDFGWTAMRGMPAEEGLDPVWRLVRGHPLQLAHALDAVVGPTMPEQVVKQLPLGHAGHVQLRRG
eukprot:10803010-Alexandrium_andersonii.AAC.1